MRGFFFGVIGHEAWRSIAKSDAVEMAYYFCGSAS